MPLTYPLAQIRVQVLCKCQEAREFDIPKRMAIKRAQCGAHGLETLLEKPTARLEIVYSSPRAEYGGRTSAVESSIVPFLQWPCP